MESIHSQPDFGHRTADFFDDASEDDTANVPLQHDDAPNVELLERRASAMRWRQQPPALGLDPSHSESKTIPAQPDRDGYQRLMPNVPSTSLNRFSATTATSFNGSVDELLPVENRTSPPQIPQIARTAGAQVPSAAAQRERLDLRRSHLPSNKVEQLLGAHALAHEITLQALMRDEDALEKSLQSFAPMHPGDRGSLLPPSLVLHDPRSPRDRALESASSAANKKVHLVPPPIDTSEPRRKLPADLVRTPYPCSAPKRVHRKDFGHSPHSVSSPAPNTESLLTLSIRRSNKHSKTRVTSLVIPASNDFSAVRSSSDGGKEHYFKALDFDDAEFFRQLRARYNELSGAARFLSARSLSRIAVSGPASRAADSGYGWLHQPRSPPTVAFKPLSGTFSEDKILQRYVTPSLGKGRYAFVHWAHRLAAASQIRTPQPGEEIEDTMDRDFSEGLEFVVSWSVARVLAVFLIVIALSIAAALLWTLLGLSSVTGKPHGGFRDAGDRVVAGVLLGICTLLVGLTGTAGWLWLSWLIM